MRKNRLSAHILIFMLHSTLIFCQKSNDYQVVTIGFYNLENLFDTENDPITFDDDRTPEGKDRWTVAIYQDKLQKMAEVIVQIGPNKVRVPPVILGVSEIENRRVLEDLISEPILKKWEYGIIHYDSPDRRGIDTGLLYQKKYFQVISSSAHELVLFDPENNNKRIYTRDQLLVTGMLVGEKIHILVNHWPSRSGGEARSQPRREAAASLNRKIIDSILSKEPYAKIITMGDLNDDPNNSSVKKVLKTTSRLKNIKHNSLYNPMEAFAKKGLGTLAYRDGWNLFDQVILSASWLEKEYSSFRFYKAGIFNRRFLQTPSGQYKGYPFRSFANGSYTGGYSDHFPVYVSLIKIYKD